MNPPQLKSGGAPPLLAGPAHTPAASSLDAPLADPLILTIGGLDPSGGAGLGRDLLTATALGARAHLVGTAWTEQGEGIHRVEPRAPEALGNAVRHAVGLSPAAIKIGMVPDAGAALAVVRALAGFAGAIVVDPVLASSRGGPLFSGAPGDLLPLLRRAVLVTPNAPEAAALAGQPVGDLAGAEEAGRLLLAQGLAAVLVKGGHIGDAGAPVVDLLMTAQGTLRFEHARAPGRSPRGTGCALATAIAVELARGAPLDQAVRAAVVWLASAIAAADARGHLPSP